LSQAVRAIPVGETGRRRRNRDGEGPNPSPKPDNRKKKRERAQPQGAAGGAVGGEREKQP
jgi:hypothetical protein